jgi:hypothetical protein
MNQQPWFYGCVCYGITIPEVAIRERLLPLHGFYSGTEGYLFWALNYHHRYRRLSGNQPWDGQRSENGLPNTMGEGSMIYPVLGGNYMATGSKVLHCPSTRLKMLRAGIEDYEFLNELRRLYRQRKGRLSDDEREQIERLLDLDALLFYSAWENPDLVARRRGQVGDWITRLGRAAATRL